MYSIVGQAIYLTRGDTMPISLSIDYMSGLKYIPDDKDTILFTVKRDFADTEPTIQKRMIITKVPGSTCVEIRTKIFPTDTKDLDAGYYVYDVQLTTRFGDVFTIVTPHTFRIMEEVSKLCREDVLRLKWEIIAAVEIT